jgi:hypothetical protein
MQPSIPPEFKLGPGEFKVFTYTDDTELSRYPVWPHALRVFILLSYGDTQGKTYHAAKAFWYFFPQPTDLNPKAPEVLPTASGK